MLNTDGRGYPFLVFLLTLMLIPSVSTANHPWKNLEARDHTFASATLRATIVFPTANSADADPTGYIFEVSTTSSFSGQVTSALASTAERIGNEVTVSRTISGLDPNTSYFFRIRFRNNHISPIAPFTTTGPRVLIAVPSELSENILHGNQLSISVRSDFFTPNIASFVQLNDPPPGMSIASISRVSNQVIHLTLSHDGSSLDADHRFDVTVLNGGFSSGGSQTSNSVHVKALEDIEGYGSFAVSGHSYPSKIEMTGYQARSRELHLSTTLQTELNVTGKTAIFHYFITVFDSQGDEIGSLGDYTSPLAASAPTGVNRLEINHLSIPLAVDLPNLYRIVVTVSKLSF